MGSESYLHRYAKQTLASWLRRKRSGKMSWALQEITMTDWTISDRVYGVCIEYPIIKKDNEYKGHTISWNGKIPTYNQLKKDNIRPLFMFDIAVINCDTGKVEVVFEVKYKSGMTAKKIKFLKDHGIEYYEIPALSILTCCRPPKNLLCLNK